MRVRSSLLYIVGSAVQNSCRRHCCDATSCLYESGLIQDSKDEEAPRLRVDELEGAAVGLQVEQLLLDAAEGAAPPARPPPLPVLLQRVRHILRHTPAIKAQRQASGASKAPVHHMRAALPSLPYLSVSVTSCSTPRPSGLHASLRCK